MKSLKEKEANPEDDDADAKTPDEIREEKIRLYKEIIRVGLLGAVTPKNDCNAVRYQ